MFTMQFCVICPLQNQLEDLISHQSSLDEVSEKAQALLQTNADAKTSHAITQLSTRYQAIIALAKVSWVHRVLSLCLFCR